MVHNITYTNPNIIHIPNSLRLLVLKEQIICIFIFPITHWTQNTFNHNSTPNQIQPECYPVINDTPSKNVYKWKNFNFS